jgi:hypothetical protein
VRQACESARAWRGGHRAFAAGQIEASVRSRTFRLQIAAMRRDNQLSEPGAADFPVFGWRMGINLDSQKSRERPDGCGHLRCNPEPR